MLDEVFIIGAGGFAAEITEYIEDNNKKLNNKIKILGYFDIDDKQYTKYNFSSPFLGDERQYSFKDTDKIIIAIGNLDLRKKVIKYFSNINCNFYNFVHHTCMISQKAQIKEGNIFCPNIIVGPNAKIDKFNVFNYNVSLPHDVEILENNIFSPYVQLTGFVKIGSNNLFGTQVVITPNIKIGDNNRVQALSLIDRNLKNGQLVKMDSKKIKVPLYL